MLMLKICFFVSTELPYNILVKSHNRTERESKGVGRDILISKKLFLELCGPRENSFR